MVRTGCAGNLSLAGKGAVPTTSERLKLPGLGNFAITKSPRQNGRCGAIGTAIRAPCDGDAYLERRAFFPRG